MSMEEGQEHIPKISADPQNVVVEAVVPVIKERLVISTHQVVTGELTVQKEVSHERVEVPLQTVHTRYREERRPVNQIVTIMPETREENGTLIIPVVREEEVVVKRLILVEEIHLIREVEHTERTEAITLSTESATVARRTPT